MKPARQELIDVVIPVYNEGNNILPLLRAFELEVKTPIRILICFDNDDDTTLEALSKFHGRLEVIPVKNEGKFAHGAVMTGFRFGDSPAVISYMADDDYNAGNIDEMVALYRNGCEIVCASRFVRGGSMVGCRWEKALIVRAVAWTLHYLGGLPCPDPTNAFRLV
jgi:dolichol-phosphate mannosyltransferase